MTVLLMLGLLLLGSAVVLLTRALMVPRLRAADTLVQIGHYGFTAPAGREHAQGFRGLFDEFSEWLGRFFTEGLHARQRGAPAEDDLAAGLRQTTPDMIAGYSASCAVGSL